MSDACSVTFTDSIGNLDHAIKGSTIYLPNAKGRVAAASAIAFVDTNANANANTAAAAPCVLLSPAPLVAATANDEIEVILLPPPPLPPMEALPPAVGKTKKKRKKVRAPCGTAIVDARDFTTLSHGTHTTGAGKKTRTERIMLEGLGWGLCWPTEVDIARTQLRCS
jgi:hypothetical protein